MGHPDYRNCKDCHRHESEIGPLSWSRLCGPCGAARLLANLDAMATRNGPHYEHWARRVLLSANRVLLAAERDRLPDDG